MILEGDKLVFFADSAEMKEWYAYLNKIHRAGLLDIESPVMSAEMLKQKTVAGKVFSFFGPGWEIGSEFIAYMEAEGSDEIIHYYIFPKANDSVENVTYAHYTMGLYATGTTLTAKHKDPERFFNFYELMNTEEGWIKSRGVVNYDFKV
jgi:ABC-type glycerol-3-phosphate transport system substrate-binding protein